MPIMTTHTKHCLRMYSGMMHLVRTYCMDFLQIAHIHRAKVGLPVGRVSDSMSIHEHESCFEMYGDMVHLVKSFRTFTSTWQRYVHFFLECVRHHSPHHVE